MNNRNFANGQHLPTALVTGLGADAAATQAFQSLPPDKRQNFIDGAIRVHTRGEMKSYIDALRQTGVPEAPVAPEGTPEANPGFF
ncbi:MAG: hypothetical protein QM689_05065 [Oscillospiraceae bacterium]